MNELTPSTILSKRLSTKVEKGEQVPEAVKLFIDLVNKLVTIETNGTIPFKEYFFLGGLFVQIRYETGFRHIKELSAEIEEQARLFKSPDSKEYINPVKDQDLNANLKYGLGMMILNYLKSETEVEE